MKLIGVYGGSGAGKSTVANILSQLLDNSVVIHLDPFMHKYTDEKAPEICQKLGVSTTPKNILSFIASKHGGNEVWMDTVKADVEKATIDLIDSYDEKDYVIIDWAFLTYIDLFDKCHYTILVDGDESLKFIRLKARLAEARKDEKWNDEELKERINNSKKNCEGPTPSFTVLNDNDHSLCEQLEVIAESIAQGRNISRKKTTL